MTASVSVRSMATVEAHNRLFIDVKISFWLSEKPSAALVENVRCFITPRGTKSIIFLANDISTQAGITILLRTVHFKAKKTVASTLRKHFKPSLKLVSMIATILRREVWERANAPVLRGRRKHAQVANRTNQSGRARISAVLRKMSALLLKLSWRQWRARISAAEYRNQLVAAHNHNQSLHGQSRFRFALNHGKLICQRKPCFNLSG